MMLTTVTRPSKYYFVSNKPLSAESLNRKL